MPASFSGKVRSLFRNAAILDLGDHVLVTLVPSMAGGLPGAIGIGLPVSFEFQMLLDPGAGAAVRGGILRFEGSSLSVDLRHALPWRSRLAALGLDLTKAGPRRAWGVAAAILSDDRRSEALVGLARNPIRALVSATSTLDIAGAKHAMAQLVGLGAGGTPAGDDFLVGFLAGLRATQAETNPMLLPFLASLGRGLRAFLDRTNDVSRVYLAAAVEGEVSERLTDLVAAIATGARTGVVSDATKAAILVGHTSGADGTLGLLLGAGAWGSEADVCRAVALIEGAPVGAEGLTR